MNKSISKLAIAIGTLVLSGSAFAAQTTASASAEVITPIGIAKGNDLSFGNVTAGNGTVTVATNNTRTHTGSLALVTTGSAPTAAKFNVTGQGAQTFAITTPTPLVALTSAAEGTMVFALILESLAGANTAATNKTSLVDTSGTMSAGAATIYAGGSLTVGATQASGTYSGTITVAVEYN